MKHIFYTLILLGTSLIAKSQTYPLEMSIYGGKHSYHKIGNPYDYHFNSGTGFGFEAKYHLDRYFYLVGDLYTSTDNHTRIYFSDDSGDSRALLYRRDYDPAIGAGITLLRTPYVSSYVQGLVGVGFAKGHSTVFSSDNRSVRGSSFERSSYLTTLGGGIELHLAKRWKVGAGYSFRYLGSFDIGHTFAIRLSHLVP